MTLPVEVLVDTSSDLTWLPGDMLRGIGITPRRTQAFFIAHKLPAEREIGYALLNANGHRTDDEVVFAEPGDPLVIGAKTLQRLGVPMDANGFISLATLATFCLVEKEPIREAA
jgi:hypothetical protein